jgi:hypothetical protein
MYALYSRHMAGYSLHKDERPFWKVRLELQQIETQVGLNAPSCFSMCFYATKNGEWFDLISVTVRMV